MTGIQINQHDITIKEYNGERVITFKDVDLVHERKAGTACDRFKKNRERFIEGEDFFKIPYFEFRVKYTPNSINTGTQSLMWFF